MRILHTADWHVGYTAHGVTDAHGLNSRFHEMEQSIWWLMKLISSQKPDALVIAGDIGHRRTLSGSELSLIADVFRLCDIVGVEVVAIEGNHDQEWNSLRVSSVRALYPDIVTGPRTRWLYGYDSEAMVALIPYPNRAAIAEAGWTPEQVSAGIADIVSEVVVKSGGAPVIVVAHLSVTGSVYNPEQNPLLMGLHDIIVDPTALVRPGVDIAMLGHIHHEQTLLFSEHRLPLVYPGSLMRLDFGDKSPHKGVVMHNIENGTREFLENPASPEFRTLGIDDSLSDVKEGTYVRIKVDTTLSDADKARLYAAADKQNVLLTGIHETRVHTPRHGAERIAVAVSDGEVVEAWANAQGVPSAGILSLMGEVDSCDSDG